MSWNSWWQNIHHVTKSMSSCTHSFFGVVVPKTSPLFDFQSGFLKYLSVRRRHCPRGSHSDHTGQTADPASSSGHQCPLIPAPFRHFQQIPFFVYMATGGVVHLKPK